MEHTDVPRAVLRILLCHQEVRAMLVREPLLDMRIQDSVLQRKAAVLPAVAVLLQL